MKRGKKFEPNKLYFDGMYRIGIHLTKNKVAIIDATNYEKINMYRWRVSHTRNGSAYAVASSPRINKKYTTIWMHRIITDCPSHMEVDHKNGNGLDNRIENLRVCDHVHNSMNCKTPIHNTSGHRGVSFYGNRWHSRIDYQGKRVHLGSFIDKQSAIECRKIGENKYFGEFSRHIN